MSSVLPKITMIKHQPATSKALDDDFFMLPVPAYTFGSPTYTMTIGQESVQTDRRALCIITYARQCNYGITRTPHWHLLQSQ